MHINLFNIHKNFFNNLHPDLNSGAVSWYNAIVRRTVPSGSLFHSPLHKLLNNKKKKWVLFENIKYYSTFIKENERVLYTIRQFGLDRRLVMTLSAFWI